VLLACGIEALGAVAGERISWPAGPGWRDDAAWLSSRFSSRHNRPLPATGTLNWLPMRAHSAPDDVLLIFGADWSAEIPYYATRRAMLCPTGWSGTAERGCGSTSAPSPVG